MADFILKNNDLNTFAETPLAVQVDALMRQQEQSWPMLRENLGGLALSEIKRLELGDYDLLLQCNPKRMKSTTAKVDPESVAKRDCILCRENLPPEQRGLVFDDFYVLCNPYPILEKHLTVVHQRHVPQAISEREPAMLSLAKALGEDFVVLYNGPRAGASTPEHLHFQAGLRYRLPVFQHLKQESNLKTIDQRYGVTVSRLKDYFAANILFTSTDGAALAAEVQKMVVRFAELMEGTDEPRLNLLVTHNGQRWTVLFYPRREHRPSFYHEGTYLISPGAVDMGGLLIAPRRDDFQRIGAKEVSRIFKEITIEEELFDKLLG